VRVWLPPLLETGAKLTTVGGVIDVGLKTTSNTGWSSIPFGATPVWPWMKSKNPTPLICTGILAVLKLVVAVRRALNSDLALAMPGANGLPEPTHPGRGISAIMVLPAASESTTW